MEKSLFLADMRVAEKYAELVPERIDAERIFAVISHEHRRTSRAILNSPEKKFFASASRLSGGDLNGSAPSFTGPISGRRSRSAKRVK